MLNNKRGFSLIVLIVAIAVIIIISTTAVISVKNITRDRLISNFMSDLSNVKQYVVEYLGQERKFTSKM